MKSEHGFTLVEVLIALAILAIAMSALVQGGGQSALTMEHLRNKSVANWVAQNSVTAIQLEKKWPLDRKQSGVEEMAGVRWRWQAESNDTFDEDIKKLQVTVRMDESDSKTNLATVTAYVAKP